MIDSPAGRAGARMGDELLEVDGKSVVGLSAFQAATRIQVRSDVGALHELGRLVGTAR